MQRVKRARADSQGFLARLRRDQRGNTMAMMAAALIPLIGFTGSAVDMARLYVVKVRLQQACDAGVLAGRHAMTDTDPGKGLDKAANDQAQQFFANNFQSGWFQAANPVLTPQKVKQGQSTVANAVSATATVTVPMVLMSYFGAPPVNLSVSCQAVFDLTDSDVMFVLDTTGSMSCYPSDPNDCFVHPPQPYTRTDGSAGYYDQEKGQTTDSNGNPMYSKIESLRRAVLLFDSTMRANADPTTHFRYGFVPYNSTVNIGGVLPSGYIQNTSWTYQSRQVSADYPYNGPTSVTLTNIPPAYCQTQRYPGTPLTYQTVGPSWNTSYYQAMYYYNLTWSPANNGTCSGMQQPLRATWLYGPYTRNLGQYVQSYGQQGTPVADPSRLDGKTSNWRGCVEELNTTAASSFDVNNLPHDLDPDFKPTDPNEKWRPIWGDAEWLRNSAAPVSVNDDQVTENSLNSYPYSMNYRNQSFLQTYGEFTSCEAPAKRLQVMSAQDVHDYVYANDFRAFGDTYHDVGMIWGTRMLSPNSVFGDSTAWPGRNPPTRSIVFMTDGIMQPFPQTYSEYGVEQVDQRVDGSSSSNDTANHTARFRVECDAAKARGITIYVVALGTGMTDDLTYCASPGQGFSASNTTDLTNAFATIAKRVAKLRISQ